MTCAAGSLNRFCLCIVQSDPSLGSSAQRAVSATHALTAQPGLCPASAYSQPPLSCAAGRVNGVLEGDLAASKAELKEWIQWSSLAKSDGILPATMLEQLHVEEAALVGGGRGLPRSRDSLDAAVSPLHILFCVCDVFSSRSGWPFFV